MRGYAELFRRGAAERPDDLANAMRRIEAESARMGVLADDLLLLAQLDQGRPLEQEPVDIAALVQELVADARAIEPGRTMTLEADDDLEVRGDDARLRQAVGNLLANARAHCPPEASVAVSVHRRGEEAVIEVSDEGPGIDPADLDRVFERFFRSDPSAHPRERWHRPGTVDRRLHRRGPRWTGRGLEHGRPRLELPGGAAVDRRGGGECRTTLPDEPVTQS